MYGMENKPSQGPKFEFELEREFKDPIKARKYLEHTEDVIQKLKTVLREGGDPDSFNQISFLLYGFVALKKVIEKVRSSR